MRHLHFLLLAPVLATLGCSKKTDDPAAGTASYKLDGTAISCQAQARSYTKPATNVPAEDYLEISLTTVPQPASGAQILKLGFHKQVQNSTYVFDDISFYNTDGSRKTFYYTAINGGIAPDKGGSFSGTFSATILQAGGNSQGPFFYVSDGVFANVRP